MQAVNSADFSSSVLNSDVPVVVDFWAEWCGPCKMLQPTLEKIDQASGGKFKVVKVNIDENQDLAVKYGIQSIPTMKIFKSGEAVASSSGVRPQGALQSWIDQNI